MNKFIASLGLCGLLVLGACTAAQVSNTVAETQQACITISPALNAAAQSSNATVLSVASYANAVCGPMAAGSVPPNVNSSTPTWLGTIGGMLQALLPMAITLL